MYPFPESAAREPGRRRRRGVDAWSQFATDCRGSRYLTGLHLLAPGELHHHGPTCRLRPGFTRRLSQRKELDRPDLLGGEDAVRHARTIPSRRRRIRDCVPRIARITAMHHEPGEHAGRWSTRAYRTLKPLREASVPLINDRRRILGAPRRLSRAPRPDEHGPMPLVGRGAALLVGAERYGRIGEAQDLFPSNLHVSGATGGYEEEARRE